jgi:hypothetical protein
MRLNIARQHRLGSLGRLGLGLGVAALAGSAVIGPALIGPVVLGPVALGPVAEASASGAPAHRGVLPPGDPSESLPPSPDFLLSCDEGNDGTACNSLVLQAIAHARQVMEKMGGMSFSLSAYEKLTGAEQLFVTLNLERTERGLPPAVVLSRSLDKIAQVGAQDDGDPAIGDVPRRLPGGGRTAYVGVTWSGGWINPLGADYGWMYDDGLGSDNGDCSAASTRLCWGHRDIILFTSGSDYGSDAYCGSGENELALGAGHTTEAADYRESDTEVLVDVCGPTPTDVAFTWAQARKLLDIG